MTTTIYKYPLDKPAVDLTLPVGAVVRHVETQNLIPTLWIERAVADTPTETRSFVAFGTGHVIEGDLEFVGTATGVDGWMVFHIFERLS